MSGSERPEARLRLAINGWFFGAPFTGTGEYLLNLVGALQTLAPEEDFEFCCITPDASHPAVPTRLAQPILTGISRDLAKAEFEHWSFPRACLRGRFSIAHVPHFGPPLVQPVPTVVTIHDLIPILLPEYRGSPAVQLYTGLAAEAARRARVVIADSKLSKRDIAARLRIPEGRIRVIYLAVDARFCPVDDPTERARIRAKYHLPDRFVLNLGGFDARKNVRTLIEAFGALDKEKEEAWKLVVAGRLPERNSRLFPDPRIGAGAAVQFIGPVEEEDKPALYSLAGAFAYPSRYEGFGLPPLEAMACGTPVLCANSSSLPEVVGDAAELIAPEDRRGWTEVLRRVLNQESMRQELRARGLKRVEAFSWERTALETLDAYRAAALLSKPHESGQR